MPVLHAWDKWNAMLEVQGASGGEEEGTLEASRLPHVRCAPALAATGFLGQSIYLSTLESPVCVRSCTRAKSQSRGPTCSALRSDSRAARSRASRGSPGVPRRAGRAGRQRAQNGEERRGRHLRGPAQRAARVKRVPKKVKSGHRNFEQMSVSVLLLTDGV